MIKILIITFIITFQFTGISWSEDEELINYHYNMAASTSNLLSIRKMFGEILKSGDLDYSFKASKEVVDILDKIGKDLDMLFVPGNMEEPYNVFMEAVKTYRKSATCIRNATEILLGYFDGSDDDADVLMKKSTSYVELANRYFDLSIELHSDAFGEDKG
ncbi:MAG: hypothetical protein GTO02_22900, partial [Candidatus Dadabacteria bacterium]|nr:hypothetical protein [Candidatus Dadabacteria bacterium]NIQ17123.1 hypothetical protein [Candidatus Dadabacteria bacterium]